MKERVVNRKMSWGKERRNEETRGGKAGNKREWEES